MIAIPKVECLIEAGIVRSSHCSMARCNWLESSEHERSLRLLSGEFRAPHAKLSYVSGVELMACISTQGQTSSHSIVLSDSAHSDLMNWLRRSWRFFPCL